MKIRDLFNESGVFYFVNSHSLDLANSYHNAHLIGAKTFVKEVRFIKRVSERKCMVSVSGGTPITMFISNKENTLNFSAETLPCYDNIFDMNYIKRFDTFEEALKISKALIRSK